jgi:hypothetical protein
MSAHRAPWEPPALPAGVRPFARAVAVLLVFLGGVAGGVVGALLHDGQGIREGAAVWYTAGPVVVAYVLWAVTA